MFDVYSKSEYIYLSSESKCIIDEKEGGRRVGGGWEEGGRRVGGGWEEGGRRVGGGREEGGRRVRGIKRVDTAVHAVVRSFWNHVKSIL